MKKKYNFRRLLGYIPILLVAIIWLSGNNVFAGGGTVNVSSSNSLTANGSACEGDALPTVTAVFDNCGAGGGTSASTFDATWYYNTTNSTDIATASVLSTQTSLSTGSGNGATSVTLNLNEGDGSYSGLAAGTYYVFVVLSNPSATNCGFSGSLYSGNGGTTAVMTLTVISNQTANAGVDQSPGDCSTSVTLSGNSITDGGTGTWTYSGPDSPTFTPNANDPNAVVTGLTTTGVDHTFTWTSANGACSNSDDMIFNSVGPGCATYCTTSYSNTSDDWISNVSFNTIDNTSGSVGYEDYTAICTDVNPGVTYTLCVTVEISGVFTQHVWAFFDFNGDGDFDDTIDGLTESVDLGTVTGPGPQTLCTDIEIPTNAVLGNGLVFRIAEAYNVDPIPCFNSTYGEAEDYCFNILNCTTTVPTASCTDCASEPTPGSYDLTACDNDATLSGNAITQGTGTWVLVSGSGTITSPSNPSTTVTGLGDGTNTFAWQVTDAPCPPLQDVVSLTTDLGGVTVDAGTDIITCLATATLSGNNPAPNTGQWVVTGGPNAPSFTPSDTDANATISGLVNGTYTIEWRITGPCGVVADEMTVTVSNTLPTANAGPDQAGVCPTNTTLAGDPVVGITGTWTQISGPATAGYTDANDGTTMVYGLTATGSYVFEWTLTGGGCSGSSSDQVTIDVTNCTEVIEHDPTGDQTIIGCNYTYTDDGGLAGDYSEGVISTQTVFCPDDPSQYVTVDFTSLDLYSNIYDNLVVFDSNNPAAPIIGYADGANESQLLTPSSGDPIVSSVTGSQGGCLYFQFASVDILSGDDAGAGWEATIGCSTSQGLPIVDYISGTNCGGLGGITLCEETSDINPDTQFQGGQMDLNVGASGGVATPGGNNGCLGSGESNEQWVYFNVVGDGSIEFVFDVAGGQDFDFAIWGPESFVACPLNTGDTPIRCSWATTGNNGCTGSNLTGLAYTVPAGVYTAGQSTAGDFFESGEGCINDGDGFNDGFVAPIEAVTGEVYVMLINNYANNNSNYTFSFTGTATLGCDPPPVSLGVSDLELFGVAKADYNHVTWTTSSEENSSHFVVQGSTSGNVWKTLGMVNAAGTTSEFSRYFFDDRQLVLPVTYYRLIQVDVDGTETISKSIVVQRNLETDNLVSSFFPNPTNDKFYFNYGGKDLNTPLQVSVYNNLGQIVYYSEYAKFNKHMSIEVDASYLNNGMYIVKVEQGNKSEVQKISVIK